jgi:nitroimidazol reductase NimA-like FMN-containing flavoprotein (pyridoxamine 5'-phosphate oxidase superfamily)
MTDHDTRGSLWGRGRVMDLDDTESRVLLEQSRVGRIVFVDDVGPIGLPVNFVLAEDAIVFATAPHNSIARHVRNRPVSFIVDDLDEFNRAGWSVVVRGTARFVESAADLPEERPDPWAAGQRTLYVQIPVESISGLRVLSS